MKKTTSVLGLLAIVLLALPMKSTADSPKMKSAIEIKTFAIQMDSKGKYYLDIEIVALIDVKLETIVRFPKDLVMDESESKDKQLKISSGQIKSGDTYSKRIRLKSIGSDESIINLGIFVNEVPEDYVQEYYKSVDVELDMNGQFKQLSKTEKSKKNFSVTNVSLESTSNAARAASSSCGSLNVNLTGNVNYIIGVDANLVPIFNGLYGARIELYFRNHTRPNELFKVVPSADAQHINFDIVKPDGSFDFGFSSTSGSLPCDMTQALLLINTNNGAIDLKTEAGWVIDGGGQVQTTFGSKEGVILAFNGTAITNTNINLETSPLTGACLRNTYLSKEFVISKYSGNLPFSLPPVDLHISDMDGYAGLFSYGKDCDILWIFDCDEYRYITIDPIHTNLSTVSHEYGHYVNYQMFGGTWKPMGNTSSQVKEGWAMFHSFAARNYANKLYGDNLMMWNTNTEEDLFAIPRFSGMSYSNNPDYQAFACYLWNLYDGYSGGNFEVVNYNGDNDDISGYSVRVFNKMREMKEKNPGDFNNKFKSGLATDVQTSVQNIYNFILNSSSTPMRSAQLATMSYVKNSATRVTFNFTKQSYSSTVPYSNKESGVKIYRKTTSGTWSLITTLPASSTNYIYNNTGGIDYDYQITAYNAAGNSSSPKYANLAPPPVQVTISGPSSLNQYQTGTWNANASGGNGTFTYQWYKSTDGGTEYQVSTSSSYSTAFIPYQSQIYLRLVVSSGGQSKITGMSAYCNNCTGFFAQSVSVSPNPTIGDISVTINNEDPNTALLPMSDQSYQVKLFNEVSGELVLDESFTGSSYNIEKTKSIKKGKYVLHLYHSSGVVQEHIVVN